MSFVKQGFYSDLGEPIVEIVLYGPDDRRIYLEALVDTGCNRGLLISETQAGMANLPYLKRAGAELIMADGSLGSARWSYARVEWFGQKVGLDVLVVPETRDRRRRVKCAVGMDFLRGKTISLHSKLEITWEKEG